MGIFGRDEQAPQGKPAQPVSRGEVKQQASSGDATVIARPTTIEGRVLGSGEIIVNGAVKGSVDGSATIRIAAHGVVEASIHGRRVSVAGKVSGDITADEKIELEPSAHVHGDITAPRILIQDGATFEGQVNMREPAQRATTQAAPKKS